MNATTQNNPVTALLQQALSLAEKSTGIPVIIDYGAIAKAVIEEYRKERERTAKNPRILVTQNEAHKLYGSSVIKALRRRSLLQPYKFDIRETYDLDEKLVVKTKGVIYYRLVDIEKAVEDGNVLKGIKRVQS